MSYWNHRVIYKKDTETGFESFEIHEVYYSKKGKIKSWTVSPIAPFGETKKVLKQELKYFKKALKKPILTEKIKAGKTKLIECN
jgi:uncharacterized OB-fold protein